ncbi:MAG: prepilin-type N-terminal cleavage/methylation domain-containing protein [Phycisphaerae bacterium]|nr:prepilin-type N-terminal cleavage/methylation domain-containing protein [Phycisphaerae bacterium]
METHTRCAASRAFTLVELLVSVLIIGILIALTLPSLRSTRNAARDARDAALIHDLLMALHAYASDFRDLAPYFGTPAAPDQPLRLDGVTLRNASYFSQARLYQHALHPGYIASLDELLYAKPLPTPGDLSLPRTPFTLAQGPYAAPDYWITEETPNDLSLYRPVGLNLVRFPSLKGEILSMRSASMRQTEPADLPLTVLIGMFDGSASARVWDAEVDARIIGDRPYGSAPLPVSATREGLFGRDF